MRLKTFLIINQVLAVAVSIAFLGLMNFYYMYQNVEKDVYYKNEMIAHATAKHISELLEDPVRLMGQIRAVYHTGKGAERETLDEIVSQIIEREPFFESMEILNEQGRIIRVIPENKDLLDINHSKYEFFQKIQEGVPVYWSNSFVSVETGRPTVLLAMPMQGGILAGYLDLQRIGDLAAAFSASYGKDISIAVTDAKGITIAHSDQNKVWQREWSNDLVTLHIQAVPDKQEYTVGRTGNEYLTSVEDIGDTGWHVIVYQTAETAFGILRRLELFFILSGILVLIGGIAFSWRKIEDAVKSLSRLNQSFMEITAGNFHSKAEMGKFSELNEMAGYFNHMVASIRERDEQLYELAHRDSLTGLGNRTCFLQWIRGAVTENEPFALFFLDLDNFKMINDTYGHYRGDQVLKKVAEKLRSVAGERALVARIGGDEFVFLVPDWQDSPGLAWVEALHKTMSRPETMDDYIFSTASSIGIAIFPQDSCVADELLRFADMAMYQVKTASKNGYRFYTAKMNEIIRRKNDIVEALRRPEVFEEFAVQYQSILTTDGKILRGFEALLRWENERLGSVAPSEFIPIAEELGLISDIGRWVLQEACSQLACLGVKGERSCIMSVNISALQLKNVDFPQSVAAILAENGLSATQLELEITETALIDFMEETLKMLRQLKKMGLHIALDDFGTGYSSLAYLHELPIDTLKIDRSFVADVLENDKSKAMLKGIIFLAEQIGLHVVAEGVEVEAQFDLVKEMKCDYCQGYFLCKPMPKAEMAVYYAKFV